MFELVQEAFASLQQEAASYPEGVQVWMRVMAISFIASLVFVYNKPGARWILLAFVVNLVGLIMGKILFPEATRTMIGTCVHLLFWPEILFVIWLPKNRPHFSWREMSLFNKAYLVWICWASILLCISLLLDLVTFVKIFLM